MSEKHNLAIPTRPIGNIYCGTCSWTDRTLIESGSFYATDIRSPEERLRYYAQVFPIVEVDATYYALVIANAVIVGVFRKECSAVDGHPRRSSWRSNRFRPEPFLAAA